MDLLEKPDASAKIYVITGACLSRNDLSRYFRLDWNERSIVAYYFLMNVNWSIVIVIAKSTWAWAQWGWLFVIWSGDQHKSI